MLNHWYNVLFVKRVCSFFKSVSKIVALSTTTEAELTALNSCAKSGIHLLRSISRIGMEKSKIFKPVLIAIDLHCISCGICLKNKNKNVFLLCPHPPCKRSPFHHVLSLLSFAPLALVNAPPLVNVPVRSAAGEFILALHPVRLQGVLRKSLQAWQI